MQAWDRVSTYFEKSNKEEEGGVHQMTRKTRLSLVFALIVISAVYAALASKSPELGRTVMLGYIGLVLTIFVANELWKRP